jgi:hypothetical protein
MSEFSDDMLRLVVREFTALIKKWFLNAKRFCDQQLRLAGRELAIAERTRHINPLDWPYHIPAEYQHISNLSPVDKAASKPRCDTISTSLQCKLVCILHLDGSDAAMGSWHTRVPKPKTKTTVVLFT